jgi:predicted acylesterase/phospholipase RssA
MAGAVSAGAYTAGVLDFLTEAMDEWNKARQRGDIVPAHDVSIEVFSGASAGGMCAAISAVMLQEDFEHIHDTTVGNTNNRFYESWVNKIDIRELLKTGDLKPGSRVVSVLDSTIINQIASYALTPVTRLLPPRPYVSRNLTLFLSLTNLRGTPYSLNGAAPGSVEETTLFFGDRIRFEMVDTGQTLPRTACAHALDFSNPITGGWDVLQTAAMATGAFPVFLAPRILNRKFAEYTPPMWTSVTSSTPAPLPSFPSALADPLETLNVDGGVTNNDPFNYAFDYLASLPPCPHGGTPLSSDPGTADRAVISIAPFPTDAPFEAEFVAAKQSGIFSALPKLFSALISQSRFFGESLNDVMNGTTFSRFVIAPSDPEFVDEYRLKKKSSKAQPSALQCGLLGAFGGFFERGFRAHDYALGRRNCQKFLLDYFVLPADNPVVKRGLESFSPEDRVAILKKFGRNAPGKYSDSGPSAGAADSPADAWIPIIPLCTESVSTPIGPIARAKMSAADLEQVLNLIMRRFRAVVPHLLALLSSRPLRIFLRIGQPAIRWLARRPLRDALIAQLGDSYEPKT